MYVYTIGEELFIDRNECQGGNPHLLGHILHKWLGLFSPSRVHSKTVYMIQQSITLDYHDIQKYKSRLRKKVV